MILFGINLNFNLCWYGLFIVTVSSLVIPVSTNTALVVIDVQKCFLPGGSLAVTDADEIIPVINNIRRQYTDLFSLTILSQDWHCADHVSFASQHTGHSPFDVITLEYDVDGNLCEDPSCIVNKRIQQTLWPDHCVINTTGAEFSQSLYKQPTDIVVKKGFHCDIDSYSAFYDNGNFTKTELESVLQSHEIKTIVVVGLALDFCVYYTAMDGKREGYNVYVVVDASRPVSSSNQHTVIKHMKDIGINVINSTQLDMLVSSSTSTSIYMATLLVSSMFILLAN